MALRPGRHGGIHSSEFTELLERNSEFLTVYRFGRGDGGAGLRSSISGKYVAGIGGGVLPEYSRHLYPSTDCACTPHGECRSGMHGTSLMRGWRNILHELINRHKVNPTKEIRRLYGDRDTDLALDYYGKQNAPMANPHGERDYNNVMYGAE